MRKYFQQFLPDIVGLSAIAGFCLIGHFVVSEQQIPVSIWVFAYFVFSAISLYLWRDSKMPTTSTGWLFQGIGSIGLGTIFFLSDIVIGHLSHPELPVLTAATHVGSIFGFGFTAFMCPVMTLLCIVSALRATVVRSGKYDSKTFL